MLRGREIDLPWEMSVKVRCFDCAGFVLMFGKVVFELKVVSRGKILVCKFCAKLVLLSRNMNRQ